MIYYYYDKDHYGREHCYSLYGEEELRQDKEQTLEELNRDELYPIEMVTREDIVYDPELKDKLRASGLKYPLYLVIHLSGEKDFFQTEKEIDLDELIAEYAGPHDYKITPVYYTEQEITADEAEKKGMYKLAKLIREEAPMNYAVKNDTDDEIVGRYYSIEEAEEAIDEFRDLDRYNKEYNDYSIITIS